MKRDTPPPFSRARPAVLVDRTAMEAQWDLRHLLDSSEVMERPISEIQTRMAAWLEHIPCADLVRSVGMALRQAVAILAFRGDLRQLECGNPLLRRVGLNLAERTSGKCRGHPRLLKPRMCGMQVLTRGDIRVVHLCIADRTALDSVN